MRTVYIGLMDMDILPLIESIQLHSQLVILFFLPKQILSHALQSIPEGFVLCQELIELRLGLERSISGILFEI